MQSIVSWYQGCCWLGLKALYFSLFAQVSMLLSSQETLSRINTAIPQGSHLSTIHGIPASIYSSYIIFSMSATWCFFVSNIQHLQTEIVLKSYQTLLSTLYKFHWHVFYKHTNVLVQEIRNSIANALELSLSCTNLSMHWFEKWISFHDRCRIVFYINTSGL